MKRMLTLITLLFVAAGCNSIPPPTAQTVNANAIATPKTEATISDADVIAKEKQVWDTLRRKDSNGFADFLAADAMEIEPDGVYDKAGSVKSVSQFDFTNVTLSDFKVLKLDGNAAVVTYLVKGPAPAFGAEGERHSTVWVNHNGRWLAEFHQGTRIAQPPPK